MYKLHVAICLLFLMFSGIVQAQDIFDTGIKPADAQPDRYTSLLKGSRVALVINQTSSVGDSSLVDILVRRNVKVVKIFVPEHGFRGQEDAGAHINNTIDSMTGLPVVSLYGKHKKPTYSDLADIDVVVYDLQDVGVRFYTYISTLQYCMEACAQNGKKIIVLDKPDPNGFYVDGPVMETAYQSFVGMQPIPIVYGMTPGEYASMLKGENWFPEAGKLDLKVVKCIGYDHKKKYKLPVAPSPNLRNMAAVYAYPSLCLFEGTKISIGRGTDRPFQQYGCPEFSGAYRYTFTPVPGPGSKNPPYEHQECHGKLIGTSADSVLKETGSRLRLVWIQDAYAAYPAKDSFFTTFFLQLSGTNLLEEAIRKGRSEEEISASWQPDMKKFMAIRKRYLLYADF